jgi:hypothetical protein
MTERRGAGGVAGGPGEAMDSRQVCDILAAVAAEVLSEVRAGRWRRPATLRVAGRSVAGRSVAGRSVAGRSVAGRSGREVVPLAAQHSSATARRG